MYSHPAYWNGAVARSIAGPNCCAMVRPTKRRMLSPATIPLTLSAVILPGCLLF